MDDKNAGICFVQREHVREFCKDGINPRKKDPVISERDTHSILPDSVISHGRRMRENQEKKGMHSRQEIEPGNTHHDRT